MSRERYRPLFDSKFFKESRVLFGKSFNEKKVMRAEERLEKIALILSDPAELEKRGGTKVVKEVQNIYIGHREKAILLLKFSQRFGLMPGNPCLPL